MFKIRETLFSFLPEQKCKIEMFKKTMHLPMIVGEYEGFLFVVIDC